MRGALRRVDPAGPIVDVASIVLAILLARAVNHRNDERPTRAEVATARLRGVR